MEDFELFEADEEKALRGNPMYSMSKAIPPLRDKFIANFNPYGLHKACNKSLRLRTRIVRYLPAPVVTVLRRIKKDSLILFVND